METSRRRTFLCGAFKGMGDLICAAPVIVYELNLGAEVTVLVYPQVADFLELLDFGSNRKNLRACTLPVRGARQSVREFLRHMSRLSPDMVWVSPHAPKSVASWKIPLLLWTLKRRYWPKAQLTCAASEPFSWLFDVRIPVNRRLPYMVREWTAYSALSGNAEMSPPQIVFKESIRFSRRLPHAYDIVIHPGAGTENRKWPVHRFAELLKYISEDYRIAVVGLARDVAALQAVLPYNRGIHFLTGSLEDAIISIARSRMALTMDSGSMFFAHILGVPAVSLFGPSDPANVIPLGWNILPVYEQKWSCQPCRMPHCRQRMVYCMASLEPKQVADQVLRVLQPIS
jgi:ADP-heptose:LPS heptosyltransferase